MFENAAESQLTCRFTSSETIVTPKAMEAAARRGPSLDVLHAILPGFEDRNAEVSAKVRSEGGLGGG